MTGLAEAKLFYETCGKDAIHDAYPEFEGRIAVGLAGHGSECFGYDDEISRDHDFDTGFCLWINDEDDILFGPRLSRLYRNLPRECKSPKSALGEKKLGVIRISDFYRRYTGCEGAPYDLMHWLSLPMCALAEAVNGEVWRDDSGEFSQVRNIIKAGYPEDVRKKKIAARAAEMAQSGQYNYLRCINHGQYGASRLAANEFVNKAIEMVFLLNNTYAPYYKWVFKAMENLPVLSELKTPLEKILEGDADEIEFVSSEVIKELINQGLSDSSSDYLEAHAFEVMERIENSQLRHLHVMEG